MTTQEVITHLCQTVGLAYHSIGDYSEPSDGFCDECESKGLEFHHSGVSLTYVRDAVIAKLKADGHEITDVVKSDCGIS